MFMFYLCIIIDCLYIKKKLSCKTVKAFHIPGIKVLYISIQCFTWQISRFYVTLHFLFLEVCFSLHKYARVCRSKICFPIRNTFPCKVTFYAGQYFNLFSYVLRYDRERVSRRMGLPNISSVRKILPFVLWFSCST